jgi:hypothetical protein
MVLEVPVQVLGLIISRDLDREEERTIVNGAAK